ncbi:MAG TPA: NHL repeat-containing protein [Bacteroidota bacterium]|nr:NHL repeat-containing protein [Bacteroidota bacterium]
MKFLWLIAVAALVRGGDCCFASGGTEDSVTTIGHFERAVAFAVDPDGNFFVVDAGNQSLNKLSPSGNLLASTGGYGWGTTSFDQPRDLALANGLDVYIADYGNHRIQRFDHNLNYVSTYDGRSSPAFPMQFGYPRGVAVSRSGILFVVDGENNRIVATNPLQDNSWTFGGNNVEQGKLADPSRIRITSDDRLVVKDRGSLIFYDIYGNFVRAVTDSAITRTAAFALEDSILFILDGCRLITCSDQGFNRQERLISDILGRGEACDAVDLLVRDGMIDILARNTIYRLPLRLLNQ